MIPLAYVAGNFTPTAVGRLFLCYYSAVQRSNIVGWGWAILAGFVGIKQGLQISTGKTILTILLSLIAVFLVNQFVVSPIFTSIF